jgi:2'-5' RNA ligase
MARLFTAIELGDRRRADVIARQQRIASALRVSGGDGLRLVRSEHLHLTLVFIGDVDEGRTSTVQEAMGRRLPLSPFTIELATCGVFPLQGPPRVLWAGVRDGATALTALFEEVSARLDSVGIPRDRRPFTPHLTLGRWRDGASARVRDALPEWGPPMRQSVDAVTLFHSVLGRGGPTHTALARAVLDA